MVDTPEVLMQFEFNFLADKNGPERNGTFQQPLVNGSHQFGGLNGGDPQKFVLFKTDRYFGYRLDDKGVLEPGGDDG
ncbi:hypothetical protein LCGC14_0676340 [marine sediment metagenome]|uniref:Uncharacterized protein n=2 Tax=root TaxID=1 RepID=A0A831VT62_9FLAO|nr:hypothetical protein [Pricia sp.]HEA22817.1 hypothetical protein [Pricia antarctica]